MSEDQDCSVIDLAAAEARLLQHANLGSEHLLLGAIRKSSIAASLLEKRRIAVPDIRNAIQELMGVQKFVEQPNLIAMSKRVIESSSSSDLASFPESERILIAICRIGEGVGPRILTNFKINLRKFESEILVALAVPKSEALAIARQNHVDRLKASIKKLDGLIEYARKKDDAAFLENQLKERGAAEAELNAVLSES